MNPDGWIVLLLSLFKIVFYILFVVCFQYNVNLPPAILSRFDLVYVMITTLPIISCEFTRSMKQRFLLNSLPYNSSATLHMPKP